MAAGGDMGASVGAQLVCVITDFSMVNSTLISMAERMNISPDQFGMKLGMLVGMILSLFAVLLIMKIKNQIKQQNRR